MVKLAGARMMCLLTTLSIIFSQSAIAFKMERNVKLYGRKESSAQEKIVVGLAEQGKVEASLKQCQYPPHIVRSTIT
jgi:hypothetical protein